MIVVSVKIWPSGDAARSVTVAEAAIANVSDLAEVSSYACRIATTGYAALNIPPEEHAFVISGHRRRHGILKLLHRVFAEANLQSEVKRFGKLVGDIDEPKGEMSNE